MRHTRILLAIAATLLLACETGSVDGRIDSDGDSIYDVDELAMFDRDTDGDGTPDYLDEDSDNDGFDDAMEAGDADPETPPRDSDGDGAPDYRDPDSDGNGIDDVREGDADVDGDGVLDYADLDDDDDRVSDADELAGRTEFPVDSDRDGYPDFRDPDSDDDSILDGDEFGRDTDGDGLDDWLDTDSDDDGLPDADEAGDAMLSTPPVDTDTDGAPDFRDPDSDDDGLPDAAELEAGSDPLDADSDDDDISDLIEVAAGTDPRDPSVSPRTRGDFVFVMPYLEPAMPARDTLSFRTNVQFADVYFLFDTTGSMVEEIDAMRGAARGILDNLTCDDTGLACSGDPECGDGTVCSASGTCVTDPRISGCIASMWSGVGTYAGVENSYRNELSLQASSAETQRRIPGSASGAGGAETLFESVACVADPTACSGAACTMGGVGCPSFREDAIRILVTITDETNQCASCPVNTASLAGARLRDTEILFVGVDADVTASPEADLKAIATAANSLDASGAPYYVQGTASAVTAAVTDAISAVTTERLIFVSIEPVDEPDDDGDARQFIDHIVVRADGSEGCPATDSIADTDGDGYDDAFPSIRPGTPVCWELVARDNVRVRPVDRPYVFRARLVVRGDNSILDTRNVYFVVPPVPPIFG